MISNRIESKQEYGMESCSDDEDENDSDAEAHAETSNEKTSTVTEGVDETELNLLRQQVDNEVKFSEEKRSDRNKSVNFNIENYMASIVRTDSPNEVNEFEDAIDGELPVPSPLSRPPTLSQSDNSNVTSETEIDTSLNKLHLNRDAQSADDLPDDEADELTEMDPKSRAYRFKLVEKMLSDARSQRSYSTSASTIAPSVIKDRIKKTIDVKEKREQRKRCVAKGEASAVTRVRNDNRDTCKEYAGWDF